jgi:hypothetical protein
MTTIKAGDVFHFVSRFVNTGAPPPTSDDLLAENLRRMREQEADGSAERRREQMRMLERVRVRADGARVPRVPDDKLVHAEVRRQRRRGWLD